MEQVGVLGLGRMGLPIARRILRAGHPVTVFDPAWSEERRIADGSDFAWGDSEYEVASRSAILVTVLPGPGELREAMLGSGRALEGLGAGSCWLDFTSNDPRVAAAVAHAAEAKGVQSVGAPLGGGPADASAGTLRFTVGGSDEAVARVEPLFTLLGAADGITRTGPDVASAFVTKLLANTLWFGQVIAVTEVLLLGASLGLDTSRLRDALAAGPGGSSFITNHLDALLDGDYLTTFGLDRVVEELDTVGSLADAAGTPHALTALVAALHRQALERFGPVDGELLAAKLLEEQAGRQLRRSAT